MKGNEGHLVFLSHIPGYAYLRVGPFVVVRDGWRLLVRRAA